MQIVIHNSVNMYMAHLKLVKNNHFSSECNYRDIYRIVINKLISIVIVIFPALICCNTIIYLLFSTFITCISISLMLYLS